MSKTVRNVIIAIVLFLAIAFLLPANNGLTNIGVNVIAIFVATIYLWITEGTGWPSLLCVMALMMTGAKTSTEIWAASWGSWLTPFLVFCFMFSTALAETGVMRRVITWFITRKIVEKRPWVFIFMFFLGIYVLGLIMDCTAESVFILPMVLELFEMIGAKKDEKLCKVIIAGAISASILSTLATPIGHVIPIYYIGYAATDYGASVSMLQYIGAALPACTVVFFLMFAFFKFIIRPDVSKLEKYDIEEAKKNLPPATKQEKLVSGAYIICILTWILPDLIKGFAPEVSATLSGWGNAFAPGLLIAILCFIRVDGKPVMDYTGLLAKVNWNTIMLVNCMDTLSAVLPAAATGISVWMQTLMTPVVGGLKTGLIFVAVAVVWDVVQTNFMSCFATGAMIYACMVPLCVAFPALGVSAGALTLIIGMCCGFGILMPAASGPPSILMSTDWFTPQDSMKINWPIIAMFILSSIFIAYPLFEKVIASL